MKYMLLINQGATPTPPSAEWDALPDDEKSAIASDYKRNWQVLKGLLRSLVGHYCMHKLS